MQPENQSTQYQQPMQPSAIPIAPQQPGFGSAQQAFGSTGQPQQSIPQPVPQTQMQFTQPAMQSTIGQQLQPAPQAASPQPTPTPQPQQPKQSAESPKDKPKGPISTQNTLLFSEMRENMMIMSDGSFRAVVQCQSINFDLMSRREREGIEFSYQNFLNSLYFPVQVLIRSRRVDIGPYLDRLMEIRRDQDNMLLNVLMDDYISFIDVLAQEANIMDKSFYIVVPYYPAGDISAVKQKTQGLLSSFFGGKKDTGVIKIDKVVYEKAKDEIKNRVDSVMSGLFQMGVRSSQLNTKQIGELLYNSYNPDIAVREPLTLDPRDLATTYVRKGGVAQGNGGAA